MKSALLLSALVCALSVGSVHAADPKPIFSSPVITKKTPGHAVDIAVDLGDAKKVFLVVSDGGNGYSCDWADWVNPKFTGPGGEV